jgi:hypothetical protein
MTALKAGEGEEDAEEEEELKTKTPDTHCASGVLKMSGRTAASG